MEFTKRVAALALSGMVATTLVVTSTQSSAAPLPETSNCAEVLLIGARGSGESARGMGLGDKVESVYWHLKYHLRSDVVYDPYTADVEAVPVRYTAASTGVLVPGTEMAKAFLNPRTGPEADAKTYVRTSVAPFIRSINEGVAQLKKTAAASALRCPESQIVMSGYSQGAMVVHQAQLQLKRATDAVSRDVVRRTVATILVADGDAVPNSRAHQFGGANRSLMRGVRPLAYNLTRPTDVAFPTRTVHVCAPGDVVCDASGTLRRAKSDADKASRWNVGGLPVGSALAVKAFIGSFTKGVDTHKRYDSNSSGLNDATKKASAWITPPVRPAEPTPAPVSTPTPTPTAPVDAPGFTQPVGEGWMAYRASGPVNYRTKVVSNHTCPENPDGTRPALWVDFNPGAHGGPLYGGWQLHQPYDKAGDTIDIVAQYMPMPGATSSTYYVSCRMGQFHITRALPPFTLTTSAAPAPSLSMPSVITKGQSWTATATLPGDVQYDHMCVSFTPKVDGAGDRFAYCSPLSAGHVGNHSYTFPMTYSPGEYVARLEMYEGWNVTSLDRSVYRTVSEELPVMVRWR